jgi:hypothetical protein
MVKINRGIDILLYERKELWYIIDGETIIIFSGRMGIL